jgi:hypothetical protein
MDVSPIMGQNMLLGLIHSEEIELFISLSSNDKIRFNIKLEINMGRLKSLIAGCP